MIKIKVRQIVQATYIVEAETFEDAVKLCEDDPSKATLIEQETEGIIAFEDGQFFIEIQ